MLNVTDSKPPSAVINLWQLLPASRSTPTLAAGLPSVVLGFSRAAGCWLSWNKRDKCHKTIRTHLLFLIQVHLLDEEKDTWRFTCSIAIIKWSNSRDIFLERIMKLKGYGTYLEGGDLFLVILP